MNGKETIKENLPIEIAKILTKKTRTWTEFGVCWEWSLKQDWWDGFKYALETEYLEDALGYLSMAMVDWFPRIIHPDRFADAVYEFLKGREG